MEWIEELRMFPISITAPAEAIVAAPAEATVAEAISALMS
jgi:hypothetical protein